MLPPTEIDRLVKTRDVSRDMARRSKQLGPDIGKRLRRAREACGLTVRELAKRAHTSAPTIQDLSDGKGSNSSIGLLADIAKALQVTPWWLCFGFGPGPGEGAPEPAQEGEDEESEE